MSRFNTAALDPIFWLHHANIDRLWAVWRARDTKHIDPKQPDWLKSVVFSFHDATGTVVSHKCEDVVDTTKPPLHYRYEDVSDPIPGAAPAAAEVPRRAEVEDQVIPEMVGATEEPVTLTGRPVTARIAVSAPTGPALATPEAAGGPRPVYLNIENITGSGSPTSYSVYLNVPEGEDPWEHPELFAGIVPMFGVAEATEEDAEHPGNGLHYVLEVGDVARTLEARNAWDQDDVRVTFVPRGVGAEPEIAAAEAVAAQEVAVDPIQVGRISLYFA
jgi:tyrosinase